MQSASIQVLGVLVLCVACAPANTHQAATANEAVAEGGPRAAAGALARRHGEPVSRDRSWYPFFQRGLEHNNAGRYADAERELLHALSLMSRERGTLLADREACHFSLGTLYAELRRLDLAKQHFEQALTLGRQAFGSDDARVAETLEGLAIVLDYAGQYGEAEERFRELVARERSRSADSADMARLLANLATNLKYQNRHDDAHVENEKAIRLLERHGQHDGLAHALNLRGTIEYARGDLRAARRSYESAAQLRERISGGEHPMLATVMFNLCGIDLDEKKLDDAEQHCGRAVAIRKVRLPADHPFLKSSVERYDEVLRLRAQR